MKKLLENFQLDILCSATRALRRASASTGASLETPRSNRRGTLRAHDSPAATHGSIREGESPGNEYPKSGETAHLF